MKVQLVISLALLTSIALMGITKLRRREHEKEDRRNKFQEIKLRVTRDVLGEYQNALAEKHNLMEKTKKDLNTIEEEVAKLQLSEENIIKKADLCQESKKSDADMLAVLAMDLDSLKTETEKEMTLWNTEIAGLKKQFAGRSLLCNFLKEGMSIARKICGDIEPNKAKEEKAKVPEKEEPKAEDPEKDQPKAEDPKKDQPKAEDSEKDQPKEEDPEKDQPKEEDPEKDQPKAEDPDHGQAKEEAQR